VHPCRAEVGQGFGVKTSGVDPGLLNDIQIKTTSTAVIQLSDYALYPIAIAAAYVADMNLWAAQDRQFFEQKANMPRQRIRIAVELALEPPIQTDTLV
jgi:hypothetical protein